MAHFAEIDENNIVIRVIVIPDEQEDRGQEYCSVDLGLGGTWLKTSYNTYGGEHVLGGTPFRKNYANEGYKYDAERDAFIPPQPSPRFVLIEESCLWKPPALPIIKDDLGKTKFWYNFEADEWRINPIGSGFTSWAFDEELNRYNPPVPYPDDYMIDNTIYYQWDEENQQWVFFG